ncbi:glycosyltransferase family 2 protein [Methanobrevibacter sp. OttesenSCG-928-K11]|nr:glycosyltransferase family 2 protein [Methanobrevibacter sp. OttesenSCG-928-K11]MDL2271093.1 glycosyltransferase family 2 protein [Methanobrevibacter sp. OttesenSCG-928-I08]
MKYKVSVIIPTYNSQDYLNTTVDSVINQSIGFENIELIIIDDFSTDNTQKIIDEYVSKYDNIKTYSLSKKTGTPGAARNLGIKNSNSEYLMFLDHDDCYKKEAVEKLYLKIKNNNADVVIGKFKTFGDGVAISDSWITKETTLNSIDENTLFLSIDNIWRMIFPKEFIINNDITFPEGVFAEDLAFMVDSFINAKKIIFINEIIYNFRLRSRNVTSTSLSKGYHYLNGLIEGYDFVVSVLRKNKKCDFYDKIFNQHLSTWTSDIVLSDTISIEDKKKILEKAEPLFKSIKNINPYPENEENRAMMENIKKNGVSSIFSNIEKNKYLKQLSAVENELKIKNNEITYLKTTKGWFKYKINNIISRLKRNI